MRGLSKKRRRALERKLQPLADAVGRTVEGDREFFDRHKDRSHRLRLASRAEIAAYSLIGDKPNRLPEGQAWYSAIRQVRPGIRLRVVMAMRERADVDIFSETECRRIYEEGIGLNSETKKIDRAAAIFFGGSAR